MQNLLCALILLGVVLSGASNAHAGSVFPPLSGPYEIGTQVRYWTDPSRSENFNQNPDELNPPRRLVVQIWYPAAVPQGNVLLEKADYHLHPKALIGDASKTFGVSGYSGQFSVTTSHTLVRLSRLV